MRYTEIDKQMREAVEPEFAPINCTLLRQEQTATSLRVLFHGFTWYLDRELERLALNLVNRRSKPRIRHMPILGAGVYSCEGAGLHLCGVGIEGAYRTWQIAGGWR